MSDDRRSPEELEIAKAAQAAPPPPRRTEPARCGAQHPREQGATCQLGQQHEGNHRHDLPDGRRLFWWGHVEAAEIDRFVKELESE
jgi:hypothetical protein